MPLDDVSNDASMINWLRQAGHGHLLANQQASFNGSLSPQPPMIRDIQQSAWFPSMNHYCNQPFDYHHGQGNAAPSPAQFFAPRSNMYEFDADVENMKRDPNTRVIQRPTQEDVVYKQRVFVRYLQPPTPPVGGAIIVREKQLPQPPPDPPLVIRRAPPPPITPPPVIIRERPPLIPPPEAPTIINKIIPAAPKPPRQVIIEQQAPMPPKPRDVIIERWLPVPPRQRPILYERLPAPVCQPTSTRPMVVQCAPPRVRIHREVTTQCPPAAPQMDLNRLLCQMCGNQGGGGCQVCTSSLSSYNPAPTLQCTCCTTSRCPPNVVVMQNRQPNMTLCPPYGCGPTMGCTPGQSTLYSVPENVPIDHVLRQLGIDPGCF